MSIESLKQKARKAEQNEDWSKALDLYNKALDELAREEQVDIGLYNRVGDLYVRVNKLDDAVENYEKAVELYREAYLPNNAIAVCKKIIRNVPAHDRAYLVIGQIRAEQGFIPDARTNFLTYAERMQQKGDLDESFRALVEFCDLAPDDVGVRITVAEQMAAQERTDEAVEQLLIVHRHYVEVGASDKASEIEARILELDPEADFTAAPAMSGFGVSDDDEGDFMGQFGDISLGGDAFGGGDQSDDADAGFAIASSMEEAAGDVPSEAPEEAQVDDQVQVDDEAEMDVGGFELSTDAGDSEEEAAELPTMDFDDDEDEEAVELPMMDFDDDEDEEAVELPMMDFGDDDGEADGPEEEAEALPTMGFLDPDDTGAVETTGFDDFASQADESAAEDVEEAVEEARSEAPTAPEPDVAPEPTHPTTPEATLEATVPDEPHDAAPESAMDPDASGERQPSMEPGPTSQPEPTPAPEPDPATTEASAGPMPPPPVQEPPAASPEPSSGTPAAGAAEPAKQGSGGGDEGFVDLGAMILGDERDEKSTRFTVAYEEPSGDEEADFAKMLSQFKDKVTENLDSSDVRAHYDLGTAYKEMGLLDEAITSFQAALRASANHLPTYELMGQTFMEMGQPEAAVRSLERAVRSANAVEDELVGIYYYLGRAYEELDNKESAVDYYDRVFALDINFADVTDRLRELR